MVDVSCFGSSPASLPSASMSLQILNQLNPNPPRDPNPLKTLNPQHPPPTCDRCELLWVQPGVYAERAYVPAHRLCCGLVVTSHYNNTDASSTARGYGSSTLPAQHSTAQHEENAHAHSHTRRAWQFKPHPIPQKARLISNLLCLHLPTVVRCMLCCDACLWCSH